MHLLTSMYNQIRYFSFRPLELDDRDQMLRWLARPHFQQWWGTPEYEWQLMEEALETGEAIMFLAYEGARPVAYIQYWFVKDARGKVEPAEEIWLAGLSDETIGVDISLLDEADLGQGLGRAVMRAFLDKLSSEGFREIVIDPDTRNIRAIRSYMGAGFVRIGQYPEEEGGTLLMRWNASHPMSD